MHELDCSSWAGRSQNDATYLISFMFV